MYELNYVNNVNTVFPYGMKTWIVSSLDEETFQGEETIQGRKLYEEIRYVYLKP